jgi:hypothetical protein
MIERKALQGVGRTFRRVEYITMHIYNALDVALRDTLYVRTYRRPGITYIGGIDPQSYLRVMKLA